MLKLSYIYVSNPVLFHLPKRTKMAKCCLKANALFLATLFLFCHGGIAIARQLRSNDGSEEWGYVEVRPKAHMFWWLYRSPYRVDDPNKPWPIILWLQGGPGASGTGIGNFQEIGPLDTNLKPRNSTWLKKADLLFVDNPVGTGFSFVENEELLVKSDEEAGADLTILLMNIFNENEKLQKKPLYIVAESYGGKYAVTLGLAAHKAILSGQLKLTLGGIALGDSWISPEDFVFSWGPLLKDVSRLDDEGLKKANSMAETIREQIRKGQYLEATDTWNGLENAIGLSSNNVDFYNFMLDSVMDPLSTTTTSEAGSSWLSRKLVFGRYSKYISSLIKTSNDPAGNGGDLTDLMEGPIRKKLKIIPLNVTWMSCFQKESMSPYIMDNLI
uniref:Carboxypeptidase n=1 Tax=Opuntia streptacantha TaxID=393608 RepID=A0A7C9CZW8_OPUST